MRILPSNDPEGESDVRVFAGGGKTAQVGEDCSERCRRGGNVTIADVVDTLTQEECVVGYADGGG
jgi:hypothetical protein